VAEIDRGNSMPDEPGDNFELLATRYLDGLSTAEEARKLETELTASAEKRNQFAALSVQAGVLGELLMKSRTTVPEEGLFANDRSITLASPAPLTGFRDSVSGASVLSRAWGGGRRWLGASRWRVAGISLAVGLLVAGILWMRSGAGSPLNAQREPQLIASLKSSSQAKWRDGLSLPGGAQFSEGQVLDLVEGHAQVSVSCGAEVVMRGPCSIQLLAPNRVLLRGGLLCVQLADWTGGFTVATDSVQILDLGKQFVVSADAKTGTVEAHAIDGKLRVQSTNVPADQRYGLLVTQGEAIRIQPASNTSMRLKADGRLFDTSLDDSRPYKPIEIHNTGRDLTPGDEDPHWRIINSSAGDFGGPRYAVTCRPYLNMYLPNDPALSQWISIVNPVDKGCPPNTMYTFETEFDLTDYDLSTVTVVAHVLADNGVMGVRINGQAVPFKPWSAVYGLFDTYRKIEITSGFVEGVNRIQFDVWNSIVMSYPEEDNPMALRVEWQGYGRLKQRGAERLLPSGDHYWLRGQLSKTATLHPLDLHF
jgi:hypothetical protein